MKSKHQLKYFILAATLIFSLSACGSNAEPAETNLHNNQTETEEVQFEGILYTFDTLGFSIKFPLSWEGKFGLYEFSFEVEDEYGIEIRNTVEVYHIATREELDSAGRLLLLGHRDRDHYDIDNPPIIAGATLILAQTEGNTYFLNFPSGVEHSEEENSETAAEFLKLMADLIENLDLFAASFTLVN